MSLWERFLTPTRMEEALEFLSEHKDHARIVAGATDLILELERGQRPGITTLIDISRIPGLDRIELEQDGQVHLGCLVTHNHCAASTIIRERAFALARACWEVGAPQIRNRGTVAGNVITASPANDSITPLMALGASVHLKSASGERVVPMAEFYEGVRKTVMAPDEILAEIVFPALPENGQSTFYKLGLRRAQAISIVNAAVTLIFDGSTVSQATVTLGSVAPTIVHAEEAESFLKGKTLSPEVIEGASNLAAKAARPIDDVRSSGRYRSAMAEAAVQRCLRSLSSGREREGFPDHPVMLWGPETYHWTRQLESVADHAAGVAIQTTINGQPRTFESGQGKTLLRLLREEGDLTGTKEGCAEGECGACTVFLDGMAVMACMVPAPRAHGAEIVTVEGLARNGKLHPIQQAFIDQNAVQCGYCTPGFLMSGAKLLEENPAPTRSDITQAVTGNLCRCTGYYNIIAAFEQAASRAGDKAAQAAD